MIKKVSLLIAFSLLIVSCGSSENSTKVKTMQRKDKKLSCKEILLEMNEADFYRKMANKNRGPKLKSMLMPLGYISTYMDAEEAIGAADARVAYLDKIYEIMRCEEKADRADEVSPPVYMMAPPYGGYGSAPVAPAPAGGGYYKPEFK